ncbi:MAG: PDZ domain-containing protein, partial [Desulfovibrionaceae bacterium]|nr:PDZ domain-containing protein [Desulfovibrionaceae bacterium]
DRKVTRGWLDVTIQTVDAATATALGLPEAKGALIGGGIPNQPAAQAGIEPGDVILKIDDQEIRNPEELQQTIMRRKPGDTVNASVWRDGKAMTFKIKLVQRDLNLADSSAPGSENNASDSSSLGLQIRPLNEQEASHLRMTPKQGLLVIQVDPEKLGGKAGIKRGDVILGIGRKPVGSVDEFNKEVNALLQKQGAIILQINRGGNTFIVSIAGK